MGEHADNEQFRRRFEREVAATQRVQGLFTAPVVAAYVSGPSLRQAVDDHGPRMLWTPRRPPLGCSTPAFMTPEQVLNLPTTPATDVFAATGRPETHHPHYVMMREKASNQGRPLSLPAKTIGDLRCGC